MLYLTISALSAALLALRLCGDLYCAALAAAVYALSPCARLLVSLGPRTAQGAALLPVLFFLFYGSLDPPKDARPWAVRAGIAAPSACLAVLGALDPRMAIAWGFSVWLALLTGYALDDRRLSSVWGTAFYRWGLGCIGGICLYAPLWWNRLGRAGVLPPLPYRAPHFTDLWRPSMVYFGLVAVLLGLAGLFLSRSYRGQARLWAIFFCAMLCMSLGAGRSFPWVGRIPPLLFLAAGQLGLGLSAAFGLGALLARLPLRALRWTRLLAAATALAASAADFLRL